MKVLIYGGTGSQGGAIVRAVVERGHEAYILTRQPENVTVGTGVRGDLGDPASLEAASAGMDAVSLHIPFFVSDPATAVQYARNAISAARAAGVPHLVYNTSGPILPHRLGIAGYDMRIDILDALKESGVPHIVLQPTGYLENILGPWSLPGIVERGVLAYPVPAEVPIGWLVTADLGALMAAALERPALAPAHFVISGVENLTGPELAARLSDGLGRTITYEEMPLETFAAVLDEVFGPGAGAGGAAGYRFQREHPELFTMWTDMRPVLDKLPVRMTDVTAWARALSTSALAAAPV